jgi:hypothetical protein
MRISNKIQDHGGYFSPAGGGEEMPDFHFFVQKY